MGWTSNWPRWRNKMACFRLIFIIFIAPGNWSRPVISSVGRLFTRRSRSVNPRTASSLTVISASCGGVQALALSLAPIGAKLAQLEGRIERQDGLHLEVWELVDFSTGRIRSYSYEVYRGEKICWYDAWEHPEIPALASAFPHHRHILPNLRDHRIPAPGISFESPNLDVVLNDVRRDRLAPS